MIYMQQFHGIISLFLSFYFMWLGFELFRDLWLLDFSFFFLLGYKYYYYDLGMFDMHVRT